jgi:glycosyltransferase involved in cell wall biosynthesis
VSAGTSTISVVVVTRDRPQLLRDALESIACQRVSPLEVLIGDDGDRPLEPGELGDGLLNLRLVRSAAGRAAAARNLAARAALGAVLAFLDDDDRWLPDHLAGLAGAFTDPGLEIAYRDTAVVREIAGAGQRRELERRVIARDWDAEVMRHDDYVPPSALAIRRGLFEQLDGFDETFRYSEDWDLLLRAARWATPRRIPGVTVEVRLRGSDNASADSGPERRACLDRLAARHGLPPLAIKTFWEVAGAVAMEGP